MREEIEYICDNCGENIVAPIDVSAGMTQEYVEDCPICCSPNLIRVTIDREGNVSGGGTAEQDRF